MAHSRSAKKRVRQNLKRRAINRWRKSLIKKVIKDFDDATQAGDAAKAGAAYKSVTKVLDKVASKGTIHKNAAARKKSRLAKRLNALSA